MYDSLGRLRSFGGEFEDAATMIEFAFPGLASG